MDFTSLETELTALKLIQYALHNNIKLPINYCSFTYRHQYQGASTRKRYAPIIKKDWEDITATGHIRQLKVIGDETEIEKINLSLKRNDTDPKRFSLGSKKGELLYQPSYFH